MIKPSNHDELVWRIVEESLPGLNVWVLIANPRGHITQAALILHGGPMYWEQNEPTIPADEIEYWMPLPEPPTRSPL